MRTLRKNSRVKAATVGPRASFIYPDGIWPCMFQMEPRRTPCERCDHDHCREGRQTLTVGQTRKLALIMEGKA